MNVWNYPNKEGNNVLYNHIKCLEAILLVLRKCVNKLT